MNFDLTDEQTMIRDGAERVVREYAAPDRRRERIARHESFDEELWAQAAELGWLALCVPEAAGGLGGSDTDIALLMIELGRGMACEPMISGALLCGGLLAGSSWAERADWLDRLVAGTARVAFANLEPGDRSDDPAPRATMLTPQAGGHSLSGAKLLVQDAEDADGYLVTAAADGGEIVLVFVRRGTPGVSADTYPLIDGSRATDLRFADVRVSADDIVARDEAATRSIEDMIARAAVATLAASVGAMEACLDLCSDYLRTRQQFGQPIGKFQALQHMMADMLVSTHNARSTLYHALAGMERDRAVRAIALSSAKLAIGQAGLAVARAGIQLHGGYGVTDEYVISHYYRFLIVLEKRFGDSLWHGERLADAMLLDAAEAAPPPG